MRISRILTLVTVALLAVTSSGGSPSCATANVRTVKIEDGELWWGAANFFGTNMPFSAKTRLTVNLRKRNYSNQCASLLISDRGRAVWSDGQSEIEFKDGKITVDADSEVFLETAARALKPGGVCYSVCKNAAGLEPVQARFFPSVEIIRRRGYAVLKSVKPM